MALSLAPFVSFTPAFFAFAAMRSICASKPAPSPAAAFFAGAAAAAFFAGAAAAPPLADFSR
jgi:hypothetical protein